MEQWEKDYLVSHIVSDTIIIEISGQIYLHKSATPENKYFAHRIYKEVYESSKQQGVWEDDELMQYLLKEKLWTEEENAKLERLTKEIPDIKIRLYESRADLNKANAFRNALDQTRHVVNELYSKKHAYDYLTCHGAATSAKLRYITGASLYYRNQPYWKDFNGWKQPDDILDKIILEVQRYQVTERQLREMARTEPWRSYWETSKYAGRGVFDSASINLSDNQKLLIRYSQMYDNIAACEDSPYKTVVEDDDMLDGWMLVRQREKEAEASKEDILSRVGEKVKGHEEVFIKANNMDEVKRIQEVNDIAGQVAFAQRMKQIQEEKVVNEVDMKETRLQIQMQLNQKRGG